MTSEATRRARAFVAEHLPEARGLGQALADLIDDPETFTAVLRDGLALLADPDYATEQERVAPGSGTVYGVRWPLIDAVAGQLRQPLRESSPASALWLAQRLAAGDEREVRLFSHVPLRRSLADDPERSWQLMRRLARLATDWISVDTLADLFAKGVFAEPFRWAELEQLVYSEHRWERRLVGSTLARLPYQLRPGERTQLRQLRALSVISSLLGDDDEQVQKALSWALREWAHVDQPGVAELLQREARVAAQADDGHRAWVIRDALPAVAGPLASEIREVLRGVRRRADAQSTSSASAVAAAFRSAADLQALSERAAALQGERQRLARRGA
ncbi:MAG: DNA alkylation repair protein [Chloroflexota bacterium]|nr:DNA alkylation repair protein [Chloroflexota bacterium]